MCSCRTALPLARNRFINLAPQTLHYAMKNRGGTFCARMELSF